MSGRNYLRIRRATEADGAQILSICRSSLSGILLRGLPALGKTWWLVVLASKAADTYVAENDSPIIVFDLLLNNEPLWREENERRTGFLAARVLSRVLYTGLSLAQRDGKMRQ